MADAKDEDETSVAFTFSKDWADMTDEEKDAAVEKMTAAAYGDDDGA